MLSHRDGRPVIVCDCCYAVIGEALVHRGGVELTTKVEYHLCMLDEHGNRVDSCSESCSDHLFEDDKPKAATQYPNSAELTRRARDLKAAAGPPPFVIMGVTKLDGAPQRTPSEIMGEVG